MDTKTTASPAQLVKGYRAKIALDPDLYDGDLDVIMWLIEDTAPRSWTPSELGRAAKVPTTQVQNHLATLVGDGYVRTSGNGAWTRYSSARS
jgi:DNA-binding MarR family transcriptional regulator